MIKLVPIILRGNCVQERRRQVALAFPAIFLTLAWSVPAFGAVTCAVRRNGQFICTYFCQDGFTCDTANNRCLPGADIKHRLSELQEKSRQTTLAYNHYRAKTDTQTNNQITGNGYNSVVYYWNGDPREIPSPHYRSGGNISYRTGSSSPRSFSPKQYVVRAPVRDKLLAYVSAARSFAPDDSNRAGAVKLLRRFVRDNKVPVDVDELLNCGTQPAGKADDRAAFFQLRWTVPDIESEIEKRGLCKQAEGDDALAACQAYQFGQVVMAVEPELKAICKLQENDFEEKDLEALGACAENKFRNALASRDGKVPLASGYAAAAAQAKNCPAIATTPDSLNDLRERLRRALAAAHADDDDNDAVNPSPRTDTPAVPPVATQEAKPDPADDEDPFCAFIARRTVRGELTLGGGDKIPDYCRKALDSAKSCSDQKCSMADIIDREERDNAPGRMPWGVDDYQGIEKLQR
jgi:hypothetical protein